MHEALIDDSPQPGSKLNIKKVSFLRMCVSGHLTWHSLKYLTI